MTKRAFDDAEMNVAKNLRTHTSGRNFGNGNRKESLQYPAAGRYRPGYPIAPELWNAFMQSRRWEDAPKVFMPLYAEEKNARKEAGVADTENRIPGQASREPLFFGLHLVCGGREFADEVDKNEMLRILCAETVRWRLPVTDFVLLDNALHMIVCLEKPELTAQEKRKENIQGNRMENTQKNQSGNVQRKRLESTQENSLSGERWQTYMLNQFALSLERRYQEYYAQRMELPCTFLTRDVLCSYSDPGQVLEACCRMHALPVSLGFTDDIRLYWFSGYNTVRGKFAWNFMDPTELLKSLSSRPDKAVRQYLAAHRALLAGITAEQKFRAE